MDNIIGNVLMSLSLIMTGHVSQPTTQDAEPYLPRPSYLANGDPAAGRRDYMALKCNTCHTVAGEPIGTKPPRLPGPQLGKSLGLESPQQIADSIAAPGHRISQDVGPWRRSKSSTMGDYTNIMTVRQLMDLVAYLRSL
jgi:mono/diheme cytochrome c family protein